MARKFLNSITVSHGLITGASGDTIQISDLSATGTPSSATYLRGDGTWAAVSAGSTGTVTSVALSASSLFSVSGSPITSAGTLTLDFAAQNPGSFLAGPASGVTDAVPFFRVIVPADLPDLSTTYLTVSAATSTYLTSADATATYLKQTDAALTYLKQSDATATYLTIATANSDYATLASPAFTGTPIAPTATAGNSTNQLATTAFVQTAVSDLVSGVSSFNARTGAITLTSSDVTTALGYTPTNPMSLATVATSGAASDLTGLKWLAPVIAVITTAGDISTDYTPAKTGYAAGSRVLLTKTNTLTDNGIYILQASGPPVRASDADTGDKLYGSTVYAIAGLQPNTIWSCTNETPPVLGTSLIIFTTPYPPDVLRKSYNLADLASTFAARANLGVPAGSGNSTGTNTGDQTITLTGDVTGSGTGTFAASIGAGKVTNSMLAGGIDLAAKVAGILPPSSGGTGVNNGSRTLTISTSGGTIAFSVASPTLTVAANSSISGTNTGDQTAITGNAGTATRLQTARTINGVSFDGSANVTVPAAGSTLTDTVPITNGGTGATTAAAARTNLGLGTAATQAATAFLQASNNLSDLGSVATARTNLGVPAGSGNSTGTNTGDQTAGTGLTLSGGAFSVNSTQSLTKLSNLTTNGLVRTTSGDGTLSVDTNTYLTGNQTITLSGDVTGSGTTAITASIGAGKVTNAMLAGGIDLTAKVSGTLPAANLPIATSAQQATGTSTAVLTTPGTQASHPSAAKAHGYITISGGVGTVQSGAYNVTGITRNAAGVWTVSLGFTFAANKMTFLCTPDNLSGSGNLTANPTGRGTNQVQITFTLGSATLTDPSGFSFVALGA